MTLALFGVLVLLLLTIGRIRVNQYKLFLILEHQHRPKHLDVDDWIDELATKLHRKSPRRIDRFLEYTLVTLMLTGVLIVVIAMAIGLWLFAQWAR